MGRNRKTGLDYFPFDVDTFQDIKIRKLIKYQSGKAVTVYALLLCLIYKGGYYMRWDEELPFIISEQTGFEEAYIRLNVDKKVHVLVVAFDETVNVLLERGLEIRSNGRKAIKPADSSLYGNCITVIEIPVFIEHHVTEHIAERFRIRARSAVGVFAKPT